MQTTGQPEDCEGKRGKYKDDTRGLPSLDFILTSVENTKKK